MERKVTQGVEYYVTRRKEFAWGVLILLLGILPRVVFISFFPTKPVSDFAYLLEFASHFGKSIFAEGAWHWEVFNPGLSVALSVILRVSPGSPEATARWATALITGLVPFLPYAIWRGVAPLWVRVFAGILLALWPGQIFFSGVVAQDNWVLFPMVALAALAVRSLIQKDRGHAILSVVLFTLSASVRQEMFVALLPLTIAAAGFGSSRGRSLKNLVIFCLAMTLCLGALAGHRYLGSGRFAPITEHGGKSMLGAYVPGAHWDLWTDPRPFIASVDPSLLQDEKKLLQQAYGLAVKEALRRPEFHLVRIVYSITRSLARMDLSNFWWSVLSPEVLSPGYRQKADQFVARVSPGLIRALWVIHALFLASFFIGLAKQHWPILTLTSVILLKVAIHGVLVIQARYFIPVVALEMLVIVFGIQEASKLRPRGKSVASLLGGLVTVCFFGFVGLTAEAYVRMHDDHMQRTYRFVLFEPGGHGKLECVVDSGRLTELTHQDATMLFLNEAPRLGEKARGVCQLVKSEKPGPPLYLEIVEPYSHNVLQGQMVERVIIDGKESLSRDLATRTENRRVEILLGSTDRETKTIIIEVEAVRPDIAWTWGGAGRITFGLMTKGQR